jgi:hypothetical protein
MYGDFVTHNGVLYYISESGEWYAPDENGHYYPSSPPGSTSTNNWASIMLDAAKAIATGYMTIKQQKAFLEENARRAKLNQPLLTTQQWGTLGTVNVAADDQTRNLMIAVAAGLGLLALVSFARK